MPNQEVYPAARWNITGDAGTLNYDIEYLVDGVPHYRGPTNFGSGQSGGTSSQYWYLQTGLATPGSHTVRITLDPFNTVAETNEADNSYEFSFTTGTQMRPAHVFDLNESLADTLGGPALTTQGGTLEPGGLRVSDNDDGPTGISLGWHDHYSVEMRVTLDAVSGYRKLIDFKNLASDDGLYILNGRLAFYDNGAITGGPTIAAGEAAHIVLTRDEQTSLVVGYVNGVQAFSFTDSNNEAVFVHTNPLFAASSTAHFLRDDLARPGENATGFLDQVLVYLAPMTATQAAAAANVLRDGFNTNTLAANDDGSSAVTPLGFSANFFGEVVTNTYVNNNGNLTFNGPLGSFTPFELLNQSIPIIAPFFADVDTRAGNVVTYGQGTTVEGRRAFGVNYIDVRHYGVGGTNQGLPTNSFQVVLIDRSDIGAGDFDIEFNYRDIQWESGEASGGDPFGLGGETARVGYSNGVNAAFELPGSAVPGALINGGPNALVTNRFNSHISGRYVFEARNGGVNAAPIVTPATFSLPEDTPAGNVVGQVQAADPDGPTTRSALQFDGVNDFVQVNDSASLRPTSAVTLESWVRFSSLADGAVITKPFGSAAANSYTLWYQGGQLRGSISSGADRVAVNWTPALQQWYHVAFTFDDAANRYRLFIDGTQVASASTSSSLVYDASPVLIGIDRDNGALTLPFAGTIDQARIWSTARSAAELSDTQRSVLPVSQAGLVAQWSFSEGSGTTTSDLSGRGNHGTLGNGVSAQVPSWVAANNPILLYEIIAGDPQQAFVIDRATGEIRVANPSRLDFETTTRYDLTVRVTDGGTPLRSRTANVRIDVTNVNEAPTDITLSNDAVLENQAADTLVGVLTGSDPDAAGASIFSFVSGPGSTHNDRFTIAGTSLLTAAPFDYEARTSYDIRVQVADSGGLTFQKTFTIRIEDLEEIPRAVVSLGGVVFSNNGGSVDYGSVPRGSVGPIKVFRVQNTGTADLSLGSVTVPAGYVVTQQPANVVAPGTETTFRVQLVTTSAGAQFGNIVLTTNDPLVGAMNLRADAFVYADVDLTVSQVQVLPGSVASGAQVQVQWTLTNAGSGAYQGRFQEQILFSTDAVIGSDQSLGEFEFSGTLNAGQSIVRTQFLTLPAGLTGVRYVIVRTDRQAQVSELAENNNAALSAAPLNILAPDLVVTSVTAPSVANSGQTTEVSWVVTNNGSAPTPAGATWRDRVYLSSDPVWDAADTPLEFVSRASALGVGESYVNQAEVTIPYGLQGLFYLIVRTDDDARVVELDNGNNASAPAAPTNVQWEPPDLRVTHVASQFNAFAGETTRVTWEVSNAGRGPTRETTWFDRIWLSSDLLPGSDTILATLRHDGALAAGDSYTRTEFIQIPVNLQGTYYLRVTTDSSDQVLEGPFNANNDRFDSTTITVVQTPPPDLEVSSVAVPASGFAGGTVDVDYTVRNNGSSVTLNNGWTDRFYLSADQTFDASDRFLGAAFHSGALAVGDSYQARPSFTLPTNLVGNLYLIAETDAAGDVFGDNRTNNRRVSATPIAIAPPPADLAVQSVSASQIVVVGDRLTLTYVVSNVGGTATPSTWRDRAFLSADATLDAGDTQIGEFTRTGSLAPGQSYQVTRQVALPVGLTGRFYVFFTTDAQDQVFEVVSSNNSRRAPDRVDIILPPANLTISAVNVPPAGRAGTDIGISYRVDNTGPNPTLVNSWIDRLYLSTDGVWDAGDMLVSTVPHGGVLAAGTGYDVATTVRLPHGLSGAYQLLVQTDAGQQVYELDELDNLGSSAGPVAVTSLYADLVVASISTTTGTAGSTLRLDWQVRNDGPGDTLGASWIESVYRSNDAVLDAGDILLREFSFTNFDANGTAVPLASGAALGRTGLVDLPYDLSGTHYFFVVVDAANTIYEGPGETNNTSAPQAIALTRRLADLRVIALTAPSAVAAGQPLAVNWTVKNQGTAPTSSSYWYDTAYLSTDATLSADDLALGAARRTNVLAASEQYAAMQSFLVPPSLSGDYYVLLATDSTNLVVEGTLETNNVRATALPVRITAGPPNLVPNLQVTQVSGPTEALSGQPASVSWTVTNTGDALGSAAWRDAVYLSLDTVLDRQTDVPLGHRERSQSLATGASYTVDASFTVPVGLFGTYYILVATDSGQRLDEGVAGEFDNLGVSSAPLSTAPPPPADLVVGTITVPSNGVPGQTATVTYTVHNQGTSPARGRWSDSLYLSTDDQWDLGDALFGRVSHVGDVPAGGSYTETLTARLPGLLPGVYHLIVRSDILNQVVESTETNNASGSLDAVTLGVPQLALGVASEGTLGQGQYLYYRVDVPEGETLSLALDSAAAEGITELYASYGRIPSRSSFDFASITPFEGDQQIVVPNTQAGTYYIAAYGNSPGLQPLTARAALLAFQLTSLSHPKLGNKGPATLEIGGARFDDETAFELVDEAGAVLQRASSGAQTIVNSASAYVTFDLRGVKAGEYFVRAASPTSVTNTLPVSVTAASGAVVAAWDAPESVRIDSQIPITLRYANVGDTNVSAPLIVVRSTSGNLLWTQEGDESHAETSLLLFGAAATGPSGLLMPGASGQITVYSRSTFDAAALDVQVISPTDEPFDWDGFSQLDTTAAWQGVVARARSRLGETYGSVLAGLSSVATGAGRGVSWTSLPELMLFEIYIAESQGAASSSAPGLRVSSLLQSLTDVSSVRVTPVRPFDPGKPTKVIVHGWNSSSGEPWVGNLTNVIGDANVVVVDWSQLADALTPWAASTHINAVGAEVAQRLVQLGVNPATTDFYAHSFGVYVSNVAAKEMGGAHHLVGFDQANRAGLDPFDLPDTNLRENFEYSRVYHTGEVAGTAATDAHEDFIVESDISPWDFTGQHGFGMEFITDQTREGGPFSLDDLGPLGPDRLGFDGIIDLDGELRPGTGRWDNRLERLRLVLQVGALRFGLPGVVAFYVWEKFVIGIPTRTSFDPNDITGPAGFGPENWVPGQRPLGYTIRFENDPVLATAPAQVVRIAQTLDADLDARSFRLGDFGFGDVRVDVPDNVAHFTTRLDLTATRGVLVDVFAGIDVATRQAFWTFSSIDPATGDLPEAADRGFLPLNLANSEGEGFVTYSVRAAEATPSGTRIDAAATIFFDRNEPIDTPSIFHTIDAVAPTGRVAPLSDASNSTASRLVVRWSGEDDPAGSALASYDVYVRRDDGPYELWLARTTATQAVFVGVLRHQYAFYAVARDFAGNVQLTPSAPDAVVSLGNLAPRLDDIPLTQTYAENAAAMRLAPLGAVIDPDSTFDTGKLTVKYTAGGQSTDQLTIRNQGTGAGQVGVSGNTVTYGGTPIGTFTGGTGLQPLVITFNADARPLRVQAVLRNIQYQNASDNPANFGADPTRTVNYRLTDGDGGTSVAVNQTLNITAVNDKPVLAAIPSPQTYKENAAAKLLAPQATVADPDSANFGGGRLAVKYTAGGLGSDRLTIRHQGSGPGQVGVSGNTLSVGGVSVATFVGGTGLQPLVITFNVDAKPLRVQAVLRNIVYHNISDNPTNFGDTPSRTVNYVLTDGDGGTSAAVNQTLDITAANDRTVLGGIPSPQTYRENNPPKLLTQGATVTDPDSFTFGGGRLVVKYVGVGGLGSDRLTIRDQGAGPGQVSVSDDTISVGGIEVATFVGGIGLQPLVISFNADSKLLRVQAILRNIQYQNTSDNPTNFGANPSRTVNYLLTDGDGGTSLAVNQTLNIAAVNDAALVGNFTDASTYTTGAGATILDANATLADADSANLAGGNLVLMFSAGGVGSNRLAIRNQGTGANQIGVSGSSVTFGGTVIGTLNANAGSGLNALIVTFTPAATPAAAQALLRNLTYLSTDANPTGPKTLMLKVRDGDGGLTTVNKTLNIAPALVAAPRSSAAFASYAEWESAL